MAVENSKKAAAAATAPPSSSCLAQEVDAFVRNINALRALIVPLMSMAHTTAESLAERFEDYAEQYGEHVEGENGSSFWRFVPPYHSKAARLRHRAEEAELGTAIVPRTFVVALVSQLDGFLGRLLRRIFTLRPELLGSSERQLSLAQILELGTVEAARDYLLEKEVEAVLRKSHAEQFKWMESRFDIRLTTGLGAWPTFIELTERRNLFVHTDGVVSEQYIAVCHSHAVPLEDLQKGQVLDVEPRYFRKASACVFEIGVKLSQVLWRKLFPADLEFADQSLTSVAYDLLTSGNFALAATLLDFACDLKKHGSEKNRRVFVINRAQAYKWRSDDKMCQAIVAGEDWSASGQSFQLCVAVLQDRFDDAASIMRRIGRDGEVRDSDYEDWPIFRRFRETSDFLEAYREVFGSQFEHLEKALGERERQRAREALKRLERSARAALDVDGDDNAAN